jgi:hypothetical protein
MENLDDIQSIKNKQLFIKKSADNTIADGANT